MFLAFLTTHSGSGFFSGIGANGSVQSEFATLEEAKAAIERLVQNPGNSSTFKHGYTVYVIDVASDKVVAKAGVPKQPTVAWSDLNVAPK
jgi:hypothetical protein